MNQIGKGIASLGVCAVSAICFSSGSAQWGGVILLMGLLFIWQ